MTTKAGRVRIHHVVIVASVLFGIVLLSMVAVPLSDDDEVPLARQPATPTSVVVPSTTGAGTGGAAGDQPAVDFRSVNGSRGGSARVGVWLEPDPNLPTLGGAGVRALVHPQLFVPRADGRWIASLAAPGTDVTADDLRSARVALREGAAWSDGSPITVADLRRTADARFVAGLEGPDGEGRITIRFTQPLPGWRRLWSGTDSVAPPSPAVWGGPFVVAGYSPGLEVVLTRNDRWYGPLPHLDEIRLVLVPDVVTTRKLLTKGELDVVMPQPYPARRRQLDSIDGVELAQTDRGGWWMALLTNPEAGVLTSAERRLAIARSFDRRRFADVLLAGEASPLDVLPGADGAGTWAGFKPETPRAMRRQSFQLTGIGEEPVTPLIERAVQTYAKTEDVSVELRNAEADRVESWVAGRDFQAVVVPLYDPPVPCLVCRWGRVDEATARAADGGDEAAAAALAQRLRDDGLLLPLWRPITLVAWRTGLDGVEPNGWGLNAAWNAWEWHRG